MKSILIFCIFFLLFKQNSYPQSIHGTVKDGVGNPLPFAGISLKNADKIIVAYTTSNESGAFSLNVPNANLSQPLLIEVSMLGYVKQSRALMEFDTLYNFSLLEDITELKAVEVKGSRQKVKIRGDTINYKVSDFTDVQDRVIGDVLKRLPGINVTDDGKISYNGKPISAFYIDGDNLLDDKYNIATTTVPNQIVENVQIMEQHQPIKMLRNKSFSDQVALNITFKKDAKLALIGQAELGVGTPDKYYANVNGMTFKKNYKGINYLKTNNIGLDVSSDLTSHNNTDYIKDHDYDKPDGLLSLGTTGNPNLPQNRYLFNNSALFNINNLITLKKDIQIKENIYYLRDIQNQQYAKNEQIYGLNDTIGYSERQENKKNKNELNAQLNLNINKDGYYLNNTTSGNSSFNAANSTLASNSINLQETLKNNRFDFANELTYMKFLSNALILNVYSYVNRINSPENLSILPGINDVLFNSGVAYKALIQQTTLPTWISNNYVSIGLPLNHLIIKEKLGYSLQSQQLDSYLITIQNNNTTKNALDSSSNNLNWRRNRFYDELQIDFVDTKINFNITLPLLFQQTAYHDYRYNVVQSASGFYFNPLLQFKYQTGIENYIAFNYTLLNNTGNIDDAYRGYILKNYRTLFANNAGLTEQKNQAATIGFFYRKAITLFFANISVTYNQNNANTIASTITTTDFQRRVILPYNNETNGWSINGTLSKYLFALNTTFTVNPSWQAINQIIIQNGALLPYKTKSSALNIGLDTKVNSDININYKTYFSKVNSFSSVETNPSTLIQINQHMDVNYVAIKNLYLKFSGDYYYNRQSVINNSNYFFSDFSTRLNFPKNKIIIELEVRNIFNTTNYNTVYLSGNIFSSSVYNIPGRTILGKVTFNY